MRAHDTSSEERELEDDRPPLPAPYVPGLTILDHPDRRRVGQQTALPKLALGDEVRLSRLEPAFAAPEGPIAAPLGDLYLSRQPIRLLPGREPGAVLLDCSGTPTQVEADGQPIEQGRVFTAAQVARGVVLLLSRRVALVLHSMPSEGSLSSPRFGLIGESAAIARVRQEIQQAAVLDVPVLLRGETGTGKDVVARAIHEAGPRRAHPFVAVNMGAIPPSLAASELFGAARGAFTGADRAKTGFFRHAHHGTLFLDEIGEAPIEVQALLLRALESGEIQPVGSVLHERVDVRVITATDAEIESAIAGGRFRGPLYYRLAGYLIRLPPLRERREDFGRLLFHVLDEDLAGQGGLEAARGSEGQPWPPAEIVARLARYDWPGNVREVRNMARRLAIAHRTGTVWAIRALIEELLGQVATPTPAPVRSGAPEPLPVLDQPIPRRRRFRKPSEVTEEELVAALERHGWSVQPAAAALGVSRATVYRLIESFPSLRKASELSRREIEEALERRSGELAAAAADLEVSAEGLRLRMTALGMV